MEDPAIDVPLALPELVGPSLLAEFLHTFQQLFGVGVRVDSPDGATLSEVCPEAEICRFVNRIPPGRATCAGIIQRTREVEIAEGTTVRVLCFTGNRYRLGEVKHDGVPLGRVVVGPYFPREESGTPRSLREADLGIDEGLAVALLRKMPRLRDGTAEHLLRHVLRVLEGLAFTGQRTHLLTRMHVASVQESYRELAEKNRDLESAYARLEELDRLKSNFLATVSHELRTPLTSILGYTEMLTEGIAGPLAPEQLEFVRTIRTKGEQLLNLITGILDLVKLDSTESLFDRSWVDVRALFDDVAETFEPHAQRAEVTVVVAVSSDLPRVWTDLGRLRQILVNLVDNAVKFTRAKGTVTLTARIETGIPDDDEIGLVLTSPAREDLVLTVSDTGIGVAEDCLDRIFDAFYQVDGSSTRRFGGAGLGLSIVRRLVEIIGARIEVVSAPEKGTTFEVWVPLGEPPDEVDA